MICLLTGSSCHGGRLFGVGTHTAAVSDVWWSPHDQSMGLMALAMSVVSCILVVAIRSLEYDGDE